MFIFQIDEILQKLRQIALLEYFEIISSIEISNNKMRLLLVDSSFIDIFTSYSIPGRWAFHWERKHIDGTIFRHDNIPHMSWKLIPTFPWHFHNKSEQNVEKSNFTENPIDNTKKFLKFVKNTIKK